MSLLHVEPDQLYLASRSLWQANYQLVEQLFRLRVALLSLEAAWQGGAAQDFHRDMHALLQQFSEQTEELLSMSLTLSRQADRWEESDQRWAGFFASLFPGE